MKLTQEGIVLQKIDYSETSVIVKLLTKSGVQSYIFQGAKRKKKNGNLISPLAILNLEVYQRADSDMGKISSIEPAIIYRNIPFDPYKSSIVFFMNEVLMKVLKERDESPDLYVFLKSILQILDESDSNANFPIKFLFELTRYLGFYPKLSESPKYFDFQECSFVQYLPNHPFYLDEEKSALLLAVSGTNFDSLNEPKIALEARRQLVYDLISYYKVIFENFKDLQSLAVLESTFHD